MIATSKDAFIIIIIIIAVVVINYGSLNVKWSTN